MNTQQQRPRASAPRHDFAAMVQTTGAGLPNRYVIYGREGIGKTSLAAQMPTPLFLQMKGETGLETLISAGQLPETPHLPETGNWNELTDALGWILESQHSYKTLIIDALNGAERLCHEHVCQRDFDGDWSEKGFLGYQRGYEVALADWRGFLSQLDTIRLQRKTTIVLLSHAKISTFKNPEGADFDRYQPDATPKTWNLTHKWADAVLFWNYEVQIAQVQENRKAGTKKGKLIGQRRILCTQNHGAYDAKNRLGLEPEIDMGTSPQEAWAALRSAIVAARKLPQPQPATKPTQPTGGIE
jgi:AAA domain